MINLKLKKARMDKNLSQDDLAKLVGATRQTIGLIECGNYNPTLNLCTAMCRVLDKTLDELFWGLEEIQRVFYLVPIVIMNEMRWLPLSNPPHSSLNVMFSTKFWFDVRQKGLYTELGKDYCLWSITNNKKTDFEKVCSELGIEIQEINLEREYDVFLDNAYVYKPAPMSEIPREQQVEICRKEVTPIICGPGTMRVLLEHNVGRKKDGIRLYINSNETAVHNIPHCHVAYNSIKNYCTLSLVDMTKIEPNGKTRNAVICVAQEILRECIQDARKKWNEIDTITKFAQDEDGSYTNKFVR